MQRFSYPLFLDGMVSVQHFYLFCSSWWRKSACSTEQCCIWLVRLIAPLSFSATVYSLEQLTNFIIRLKYFQFDSSLSPLFFSLFFSFLALMNHD